MGNDSRSATDRNSQSCTDLKHADVTELSEPFRERTYADVLDGIEVDGRSLGDGVLIYFEYDFGSQSLGIRCAWGNECSPQPLDRSVACEHHDRTPRNLWELAPPHFAPGW